MRVVSWLLMGVGVAGIVATFVVVSYALGFACGYTSPCRRSTSQLWGDFLTSHENLYVIAPVGFCVALVLAGLWLGRRDRAHRRDAGTGPRLRR